MCIRDRDETCQGILDQMSEVSVKGLCYFENGIYAIISKDPIETLDDMKGKKIRAIESNLQTDTYACLLYTSPGVFFSSFLCWAV